jgi:hypothetical protein
LIEYTTSLGNFFESMAMLIRQGFVDRELALEIWNRPVVYIWEALAPITVINRRAIGNILWENFEYLTVLSQDWLATHSEGTYPPDARRIDLQDLWLEADSQYAASRASSRL